MCGASVPKKDGGTPTCTEHIDAGGDKKCDICGADIVTQEPEVVITDFTITLKDQDGTAIAGAVIKLVTSSGEEACTVTTDGNGAASGSAAVGTYTAVCHELPFGFIAADTSITLTEGTNSFSLSAINNIPNGTQERPFVIVESVTEAAIPAATAYYFTLKGAESKTLVIENGNVKLTVGGTVYTPDSDGKIEVLLASDANSIRFGISLLIENTADTENDVTINLISELGSIDNPVSDLALSETITAPVEKESSYYYRWVATAGGTLSVSTDTVGASVQLYNTATMQVVVTDNTGGASVAVNEGDEISIIIESLGIEDINKAMEPMFTTSPGDERSGMGFTVMASFCDKIKANMALCKDFVAKICAF